MNNQRIINAGDAQLSQGVQGMNSLRNDLAMDAAGTVLPGVPIMGLRAVGKVDDTGRMIAKMDPNKIRFTQNSVSNTFKNGNTLESTVNGLKSGKILPNDIPPIRIFEKGGEMYSLDNRRLNVFQRTGMDIPTVRATPQEIQKEFGKKFNPINGGKSINIRKNNLN